MLLFVFYIRFALDIDLDAPKVRVPIRDGVSSKCESHFLLDFGHFTLRTKVCGLFPFLLCIHVASPLCLIACYVAGRSAW